MSKTQIGLILAPFALTLATACGQGAGGIVSVTVARNAAGNAVSAGHLRKPSNPPGTLEPRAPPDPP